MTHTTQMLWCDEVGTTSVEYALLLALVVIAGVSAWGRLADTVANMVIESSTQISNGPST